MYDPENQSNSFIFAEFVGPDLIIQGVRRPLVSGDTPILSRILRLHRTNPMPDPASDRSDAKPMRPKVGFKSQLIVSSLLRPTRGPTATDCRPFEPAASVGKTASHDRVHFQLIAAAANYVVEVTNVQIQDQCGIATATGNGSSSVRRGVLDAE